MPKLSGDFFSRPAPGVAKDLLGKFLVRKLGREEIALMISETEAYEGPHDLASHARFGPTKRNASMFGPPGHWYVYFTYGMHWMLNVTTRAEGDPSAVLIRAAGDVTGPARLTKFLKIDGTLTGRPADPASGLWIEDRGISVRPRKIKKGPRVGVDYAGPIWAGKPWRFRTDPG